MAYRHSAYTGIYTAVAVADYSELQRPFCFCSYAAAIEYGISSIMPSGVSQGSVRINDKLDRRVVPRDQHARVSTRFIAVSPQSQSATEWEEIQFRSPTLQIDWNFSSPFFNNFAKVTYLSAILPLRAMRIMFSLPCKIPSLFYHGHVSRIRTSVQS